MRLLEVAAMPFPSHQGTQAFVREQCEALARRGHEVHLLVYSHAGYDYEAPFALHRLPDWPRERSLRSGPSWRKLALDLRLAAAIRRLDERLRPDVVHAHNYEALAASVAARPRGAIVYHAHTLLGLELETFAGGRALRAGARLLGEAADAILPRRAAATIAVSPRLARELRGRGHPPRTLRCVLPAIGERPVPQGGEAVRRSLELDGAEVVAYCGNLDRYQGLGTLLDAAATIARARARVRLLVVTDSATNGLEKAAAERGLGDRLVVAPHGPFSQALRLLSASNVCVVPRHTPGGFPMKLLAYMAAARPSITTVAGTGGLSLGRAAIVVGDRDAGAMARAIGNLLDRPQEARERGLAGRRLVEATYTWDRACDQMDEVFRLAATGPDAVRDPDARALGAI